MARTLLSRERNDLPRDRRSKARSRRERPLEVPELESRQLLATTLTGNVAVDFPENKPGVIVIRPNPNDPAFVKPLIPPNLIDLIKVSGMELSGIRMEYDRATDTLSIGMEQPANQKTGQPVIAGDIDNNLNGGTVDPAVLAIVDDPDSFIDFVNLGGTEQMGILLDLNKDGVIDIVAGVASVNNSPDGFKGFQVARYAGGSTFSPQFGERLTQFEGDSSIQNTPANGALEFKIANFSQLYASFNPGATRNQAFDLSMAGFAGSGNDDGITEAFLPLAAVQIPPPVVNPPILINPHDQGHINTFRQTTIRVNIFGSATFNVNDIDPSTVRLAGARPTGFLIHNIGRNDGYLDALFTFNSKDLNLPRGPQNVQVTGQLKDGTEFSGTVKVYNQPIFFPNRQGPSRPLQPVPGSSNAQNNRAPKATAKNAQTPKPVQNTPAPKFAQNAGQGSRAVGRLR